MHTSSGTVANSPRLQYITLTWLIRQAVPIFPHPPPSTKVVNTSFAEFLGQVTQSAIMKTKNPMIWTNKETISNMGNTLAPQVLKKIVTTRKASMINVYCQFGNKKSVFVMSIAVSTMVVTMKTEDAILASQPRVDIQPAQ
jgi:hypothetical protein